jgi:hypothetical protein
MNDGFRVAMGFELVTAPFEIRCQILEVVNLAIKNDSNRPVFAEDGLVATSDVDNRKTSHAQRDARFNKRALVVRPAMSNYPTHPV